MDAQQYWQFIPILPPACSSSSASFHLLFPFFLSPGCDELKHSGVESLARELHAQFAFISSAP